MRIVGFNEIYYVSTLDCLAGKPCVEGGSTCHDLTTFSSLRTARIRVFFFASFVSFMSRAIALPFGLFAISAIARNKVGVPTSVNNFFTNNNC